VIINTLFYVVIGGYSTVTIVSGLYFKKMISNYGLISTLRIGRLWLTYGSIVLLIFSIFYLVQIIMLSVKYRNLRLRNAELEEELKKLRGDTKEGK
jgi:hypothetical protein